MFSVNEFSASVAAVSGSNPSIIMIEVGGDDAASLVGLLWFELAKVVQKVISVTSAQTIGWHPNNNYTFPELLTTSRHKGHSPTEPLRLVSFMNGPECVVCSQSQRLANTSLMTHQSHHRLPLRHSFRHIWLSNSGWMARLGFSLPSFVNRFCNICPVALQAILVPVFACIK